MGKHLRILFIATGKTPSREKKLFEGKTTKPIVIGLDLLRCALGVSDLWNTEASFFIGGF
jgi:hypothetical protein